MQFALKFELIFILPIERISKVHYLVKYLYTKSEKKKKIINIDYESK